MQNELRLVPLVALFFFCHQILAQQLVTFDSQKEFIKTIHNKFRTNLPDYVDFHLAHPDARHRPAAVAPYNAGLRSSDLAINDTPEAESELHAAINPLDSNNIIIAAMRNNPTNLLNPLSFPIYYTKDFGASWQASKFDGVPSGELMAGGGDPVLVFDSKGVVHLTYLTVTIGLPDFKTTMALRYAYSEDGGQTWTESEELIDSGSIDPINPINSERLVDKEWLAIDRSEKSPYFDDVYMQYVEFRPDTLENVNAAILLKKKKAEASVFEEAITTVNSKEYLLAQYSSIAVDNEGAVHSFFMGIDAEGKSAFYHALSTDGGSSFSPETKISDFHLTGMLAENPVNAIPGIDSTRIYPCPHMRADISQGPYDGTLYAVWTADGTTDKATQGVDIYFTKSEDGGSTWQSPRILNDNTDTDSHQFFPSLQVNDQGTVIITWYDRRDDPEGLNTHYYITYSFDGGETFETNFPVSTVPSDFENIGEKNGGFGVGEYTQVIASSSYAIPVWSDGRSNDGNIELFIAFIPIYNEVLGFEQISTISPGFTFEGPYPNPVEQTAILKLTLQQAASVDFELHSIDGQLLRRVAAQEFPAGQSQYLLETTGLPAGMYTLSVRSGLGFLSKRIVVR